jgi:predicted esterase
MLSILVVLLVAMDLRAQQDDEVVVRMGTPVPEVVSASDSAQRYAVYLPSTFRRAEKWPVLFLMDPRGRAMVPLALFRRAAEEFGYVILSSYGTLSDDATAFERNDRAVNAMLVDAQARFSADPERIYLVGFSGTAHYAWTIASELDGNLAGIIGVGGGLPAYSKPIQLGMAMKRPFAFFAIAGIGDFNYDGVRWLSQALDTTRVSHRFVTHPGRHEWPPDKIAFEAVEWMQLQAMKTGLIETKRRFVRDLAERYFDEAQEMEEADDRASAYWRYREIVTDFDPFGFGGRAQDRLQALAADQDVLDELTRRDELSRRVQLYKLSVRDFRRRYRETKPVMRHDEALRMLRIPALLEEADDPDLQNAGAARRMLASAYANTGFYEPREYLGEGDFERAVGMLRIAESIYTGLPRTCYWLAQALAQTGDIDGSLESLSCALGSDWYTIDSVEADSLFDPIRNTDGYRRLSQPKEYPK